MSISNDGLKIVKHFESLELKAYPDPVGIWTIGYGHIGPEAFAGNIITEEKAEELLRGDMKVAEDAVEKHISAALEQREYDALASFAFNVGGGALKSSTLRRKLNDGDRDGAAEEFLRWNKGTIDGVKKELPGLTRRRKAERHMFKTGEVNFFSERSVADPDEDTPATGAGGDYLSDFSALVGSWGLRHFRPTELLTMGGSHGVADSPAFGLNTRPPREAWDNIRDTAVALDQLRATLGAPINILSAYRSPAYNAAVGGAAASQHMEFRALDFYAKSLSGPSHWASALADIRAAGVFSGGIFIYDSFVHLDCRGENVGP